MMLLFFIIYVVVVLPVSMCKNAVSHRWIFCTSKDYFLPFHRCKTVQNLFVNAKLK